MLFALGSVTLKSLGLFSDISALELKAIHSIHSNDLAEPLWSFFGVAPTNFDLL